MPLRRLLLAALAVLATSPLAAQPAPAPTGSGLYLVEFTTGPGWRAERAPQDQDGFSGHSENLARLRAAGVLLFGARYGDKGVILLQVADETAARAELAADPALAAGVFMARVHEFRPFYSGEVPASGHPPAAPDGAAPKR